ncbi:MAG: hypothetical protein ACI4MP_02765, partial [Candidatus Ventricola sp.]
TISPIIHAAFEIQIGNGQLSFLSVKELSVFVLLDHAHCFLSRMGAIILDNIYLVHGHMAEKK